MLSMASEVATPFAAGKRRFGSSCRKFYIKIAFGVIVDDVLETAAGDFTSQSIAGSSFSVADKSFQFAATAYQVAGDVL